MKKMLKGFTLVEIMIVVAIIAILAAVAIPNFLRYQKSSHMTSCIANMNAIASAYVTAQTAGSNPQTIESLIGVNGDLQNDVFCPTDKSKVNDAAYDLNAGVPTCKAMGADEKFPHVRSVKKEEGGSGDGNSTP